MTKIIDMTSKRIGLLLVIERSASNKTGQARWLCQCDCGNTLVVQGNHLRSGHTQSCGCLARLINRDRQFKHGDSFTPTHRAWTKMKSRCLNPSDKSYKYYGGRGITVCQRWLDYNAFLADMGPKPTSGHSLDRINVNGSYEPGNCRWASKTQQARNMRKTVYLSVDGQTIPLADLAETLGIRLETLRSRLLRGWTADEIIQPLHYKRSSR